MGVRSKEKTRNLAWQVDSPPSQCSCAWCVKSSWVPVYEILWYLLFSELKNSSKQQKLADISDIQWSVTLLLKDIPENVFQNSLRQSYHESTQCMDQQGRISKQEQLPMPK
jgi:hypothetical protein